jgi:regulatory protein
VDGLKMLARRELSEAQVRLRLGRKGYGPDEIDDALERLRRERAVDDARVPDAIAHTETSLRGRGRLRVRRRIEQAGIDPGIARRAVDHAFSGLDDDAMIEAALAKRLRGRPVIEDDAELARLHRFLVGQGFDPEHVVAALRRRRK